MALINNRQAKLVTISVRQKGGAVSVVRLLPGLNSVTDKKWAEVKGCSYVDKLIDLDLLDTSVRKEKEGEEVNKAQEKDSAIESNSRPKEIVKKAKGRR